MSQKTDGHEAENIVFVTGATGYIGGRLVPHLLDAGYRVRCLTRDRRKLVSRPWADREGLEVVEGEVDGSPALAEAMKGCRAAYYLVHSMMTAGKRYAEVDRRLATEFARAAESAGLGRIIYLGGLGETGAELSEHLSSRRQVEEALASTSVPVTTLRAAMIIGAGSASFEILRYLVERLPVMVTPKWVRTECQPVAVSDVVQSLSAILELPETIGRTYDVGGPDVRSYREIMQIMAEVRGLPRRIIIPVPVLTPRLSSLWIHIVTPISHKIARPLAEGLKNRVVCRDNEISRVIGARFLTVREAIEAALGSLRDHTVQTAWSDAGVMPGDPDWAGGAVFEDRRTTEVRATRHSVFRAFSRIGGEHGYWGADWMWWLRGIIDRFAGGPGLRRGRRDSDRASYGDAVDFWRVTDVEQDRCLQLRAEMKLPGEALLEFDIEEVSEPNRCRLVQTARFKPRGLIGILYWYTVSPLHGIVFQTMLKGIREEAESDDHLSELSAASRA